MGDDPQTDAGKTPASPSPIARAAAAVGWALCGLLSP